LANRSRPSRPPRWPPPARCRGAHARARASGPSRAARVACSAESAARRHRPKDPRVGRSRLSRAAPSAPPSSPWPARPASGWTAPGTPRREAAQAAAFARRQLDPACPRISRRYQAAFRFRLLAARIAASRPAYASTPTACCAVLWSRLRESRRTAATKEVPRGAAAELRRSSAQRLPMQVGRKAAWPVRVLRAEPTPRWPQGKLAKQPEAE
jgi:hypothetical protein